MAPSMLPMCVPFGLICAVIIAIILVVRVFAIEKKERNNKIDIFLIILFFVSILIFIFPIGFFYFNEDEYYYTETIHIEINVTTGNHTIYLPYLYKTIVADYSFDSNVVLIEQKNIENDSCFSVTFSDSFTLTYENHNPIDRIGDDVIFTMCEYPTNYDKRENGKIAFDFFFNSTNNNTQAFIDFNYHADEKGIYIEDYSIESAVLKQGWNLLIANYTYEEIHY